LLLALDIAQRFDHGISGHMDACMVLISTLRSYQQQQNFILTMHTKVKKWTELISSAKEKKTCSAAPKKRKRSCRVL
jgi:hypothetical protein